MGCLQTSVMSSKSTVGNIWRSHHLKPHRVKSFKLSRDARFLEKSTDVVGLYLNPPQQPWCSLWMKPDSGSGSNSARFYADLSWSSDQWSFGGIEEFPNIEAVQKYMAALKEVNWFRYCEATNVLGTKWQS